MEHDYLNDAATVLLDKIGVAVIIIDQTTNEILFVNDRVEVDLETPFISIENKDYHEIFWPEFIGFYNELAQKCEDGEEHTGIYYWTEKSLWEQVSASSFKWQDKDSILLTITNVNEVARSEYEYKQMAFFDRVTGLPNERQLERDINELVDLNTVTLVFFVIESIKDIYDLYGWDAGDALCVSVCDWLYETKLSSTLLYRVDDAFVMMGRGVTERDLENRARNIRGRFAQSWTIPLESGEFSVYCTVKIGIVYGKYVRNEMSNIIMRTLNMPDREDLGSAVYDEKAEDGVKRIRRLRNELIDSIYGDMKNFEINYHPIVDLCTDRWVGAEALCRWSSETEGPVSPKVFIPLVEQLGLVGHLDDWVRTIAMQQCSAIGLNKKEFVLDVNFSPQQAVDCSFVENVFLSAQKANFPLNHLMIEITESQRMQFDETTLKYLETLTRTGAMLGLDDFGSGYSSLENLIKISASIMKTDKLLVDNIEHDQARQTVMETLINFSHNLNMFIVVEGIERKAQIDIVKQLGADYVQGYYYSRPLTIDQLCTEAWHYTESHCIA